MSRNYEQELEQSIGKIEARVSRLLSTLKISLDGEVDGDDITAYSVPFLVSLRAKAISLGLKFEVARMKQALKKVMAAREDV